ncbi:serine--tRNA ligase [candidate division WWE3 bacterium CG10_big_fil_rev_8_21_14_0_10_32_10]|uniref:Serine--tRNA ligase n=1 Tax=candidate division WWE3 bacterium CG10_big_fil_rev_8_21_14_0_10_32_10 TaxID=1975090 RepID=A0A2H0R9J0_UNCKA|nr:MAG: serine--tRNA ligase [candidate division WWE3 bacterium CG10_big_fil_rev_8_21_14_0_10_32_10]
MLDINYIRENLDKVKKALVDRGMEGTVDMDRFLSIDDNRRGILSKLNPLQAERNTLSDQIAKCLAEERKPLIEKGTALKNEIKKLEEDLRSVESEYKELILWIPNIPLDDVPVGKNDKENVEIKAWKPGTGYLDQTLLSGYNGSITSMPKYPTKSSKDFSPVPHWEIGEKLDLIDLNAGSKVSGSRFYFLKNEGVLIVYAIFDLLLKKLVKEGFSPMIVPLLVKEDVLYGTSHFPGDADQVYKVDNSNVENKNQLYLLGSSEPSLFSYYMNTTLSKEELPKKMVAITPCFRSEAGSWGKDVRGIKRTHQFDKLEMDVVVEGTLEESKKIHEQLLSINEWLLQTLELPYHVINMCTGDLGYFAAAKKYDVEVWLPSVNEYMEVMSDSITTDYQARRLNIKYKDKANLQYVHTVNDTGATHRLLIAILDNYQQKDGSVIIPEALRAYIEKDKIVPKK